MASPLEDQIHKLEARVAILEQHLEASILFQKEVDYASQERKVIVSCDASYNDKKQIGTVAAIILFPDRNTKEICNITTQKDSNLAELDAVHQAVQSLSINSSAGIKELEIRTDNEHVSNAFSNKNKHKDEIFKEKYQMLKEFMDAILKYPYKVVHKKRRSTYGLQKADTLCRMKLKTLYENE